MRYGIDNAATDNRNQNAAGQAHELHAQICLEEGGEMNSIEIKLSPLWHVSLANRILEAHAEREQMTAAAHKYIRRLAEHPARSQGQKNRRQKEKTK